MLSADQTALVARFLPGEAVSAFVEALPQLRAGLRARFLAEIAALEVELPALLEEIARESQGVNHIERWERALRWGKLRRFTKDFFAEQERLEAARRHLARLDALARSARARGKVPRLADAGDAAPRERGREAADA